jgi:hypothetical protein
VLVPRLGGARVLPQWYRADREYGRWVRRVEAFLCRIFSMADDVARPVPSSIASTRIPRPDLNSARNLLAPSTSK